MSREESNLERLLKARAAIDDELRRQKHVLSVLFTDLVGSTRYFERYGDTAGLALVRGHADLASEAVVEVGGRVVKTIGDSVMAVFDEPAAAVRAACEVQRRLYQRNQGLPQRERHQLRIGINHGPVFSAGHDVFGDAVNVAARICKHTGAAQILISHSVWESLKNESDLSCNWIGKLTFEGKSEKQDIFEVIWTDRNTYMRLRERLTGETPPKSDTPAKSDAPAEPKVAPKEELAPTPASPAAPFQESPALQSRFEILNELGRGGMGIVYKARDRETGEVVAIKILRPELAADPAAIERFKKELRLARKITHKNVCRIYDFHRAENMACISMEFVEGESLRRVLGRFGTLSVSKGILVARQICAGLHEAHAQEIVHRDLKPENIMLDEAGNVKVMDFGIARLAGASTQSTAMGMGTPAYMAPEQVESKPITAATDIYALGLILYEMFTGAPTFMGDTPIAVAIKQLHETPRPLRTGEGSLPAYLGQVILKCLEKNPAERFQSVEELEAALTGEQPESRATGVRADERVPQATPSVPSVEVAREPARPGPAQVPSTSGRKIAWVAAGVLLAAAGGIALWRWSPSAPPKPAEPVPQSATPAPAAPPTLAPVPAPSAPKEPAPQPPHAEPEQTRAPVATPPAQPPAEAPPVLPRAGGSAPAAAQRAEILQLLARARQAALEERREEALAALENVLALDPSNDQAAAGVAMLKGRQLLDAGQYDGAVRMLEEAQARAPGDPRIRQALDRARRAQAADQRTQGRQRPSP